MSTVKRSVFRATSESMVIQVRESSDVLRLVNRVAGSKATYTFQDILGKSPALLQCIKLAQNASRGNANVLILGASGTGKELVAQAIDNHSPRRPGGGGYQQGPFSCGDREDLPRRPFLPDQHPDQHLLDQSPCPLPCRTPKQSCRSRPNRAEMVNGVA
jgi:hypothetical protein